MPLDIHAALFADGSTTKATCVALHIGKAHHLLYFRGAQHKRRATWFCARIECMRTDDKDMGEELRAMLAGGLRGWLLALDSAFMDTEADYGSIGYGVAVSLAALF